MAFFVKYQKGEVEVESVHSEIKRQLNKSSNIEDNKLTPRKKNIILKIFFSVTQQKTSKFKYIC